MRSLARTFGGSGELTGIRERRVPRNYHCLRNTFATGLNSTSPSSGNIGRAHRVCPRLSQVGTRRSWCIDVDQLRAPIGEHVRLAVRRLHHHRRRIAADPGRWQRTTNGRTG